MTGPRRPSILVVDDDASIRQLLRILLEAQGYAVRTAVSGAAALRAFTASVPDCVLLDLMMPGLDGYEVLRHIRGSAAGMNVLVVMLTAASDDRHAWEAWRSSVDLFVGKPFDIGNLLAYLATHLPPITATRQGEAHDTAAHL